MLMFFSKKDVEKKTVDNSVRYIPQSEQKKQEVLNKTR